jgi:hypothetical protein
MSSKGYILILLYFYGVFIAYTATQIYHTEFYLCKYDTVSLRIELYYLYRHFRFLDWAVITYWIYFAFNSVMIFSDNNWAFLVVILECGTFLWFFHELWLQAAFMYSTWFQYYVEIYQNKQMFLRTFCSKKKCIQQYRIIIQGYKNYMTTEHVNTINELQQKVSYLGISHWRYTKDTEVNYMSIIFDIVFFF